MRTWRALLAKEAQAIAWPAGGAIAVMVAAGFVFAAEIPRLLSLVVYVVGPVALGALVVGHEYTHHTFPTQLTLPVPRRQLLLAKGVVLAVVLLALGLAAHLAAEDRSGHAGYGARVSADENRLALVMLPLACGFFLAPAFTALTRSTLAGMVFATAVPACLWMVGELAGLSEFGPVPTDHPLLMAIKIQWLQTGLVAACAAGAIGLWVGFPRVQVAGSAAGQPLRGLRARRAAGRERSDWLEPRRRPVWLLLVRKELRLQQMTFVVAGIFALVCVPFAKLQNHLPGVFSDSAAAVTFLYALFVAMLAGSLASAEERQLGTVEWQTLLPVAAGRQWLVKVATTFTVSLGLGIGVPYVMSALLSSDDLVLIVGGRDFPEFVGIGVLLTGASLYVSSLSSSGVGALVLSFPALAGAAVAIAAAGAAALPLGSELARSRFIQRLLPEPGRQEMAALIWAANLCALVAIGAFLLWIVFLAMRNHRSPERGGAFVRRQLVRVGFVMLGGIALSAIVNAVIAAMRYGHLLRFRGR